MQRELYEVEKDRFDLKDSSVYHLQGTWPKDYKAEAVLDGIFHNRRHCTVFEQRSSEDSSSWGRWNNSDPSGCC